MYLSSCFFECEHSPLKGRGLMLNRGNGDSNGHLPWKICYDYFLGTGPNQDVSHWPPPTSSVALDGPAQSHLNLNMHNITKLIAQNARGEGSGYIFAASERTVCATTAGETDGEVGVLLMISLIINGTLTLGAFPWRYARVAGYLV